jgi:hypothetical protein
MLVYWLASTYRSGQKVNGILYLHQITDTRTRGLSLRNLPMFQELIGEDFQENLTLGTTCWSLVDFDVAIGRETELKMNNDFWRGMIVEGARLERVPEYLSEAQNLVYDIARHAAAPLQIQRDVVDKRNQFK